MKYTIKKFDYFKLTPLIVLLWSLFSFAFIPIIPVASGFGWDGIFYGKVVMDFQNMIGNKLILLIITFILLIHQAFQKYYA